MMKHIKYEITAFVFFICVLMSDKAGVNGSALVIIDGICILALCVIGFLAAAAVERIYGESKRAKADEILEMEEKLRNVIKASEEKQSVSYVQIKELMEELNHTTSEYTKRVDSLMEIQDKFNSCFHDYISEAGKNDREMVAAVRSCKAEIEKTAHDFCEDYLKLSEDISGKNRKDLEAFRTDIQQSLADYIKASESLTDEMKAVKALVKTYLDSFKTNMQEQTNGILIKLEDCEDSIDSNLSNFVKEQKKCNENQTQELSNRVKSIETVIAEQVGRITKANEDLLKYTQKMQEEWTTLSRDEINFLSRVWDEA